MNQHQTHALRRLFLRIAPFDLSDPRLRTSWRKAKRDYNAQPRPERAAYLARLTHDVEIAEKLRETETV